MKTRVPLTCLLNDNCFLLDRKVKVKSILVTHTTFLFRMLLCDSAFKQSIEHTRTEI